MSGQLDLDDLRNRLPFYAREVALATLGDPSIKTRVEWRWGRKGSFALAITGPKAGLWCDHETADGGDLFALIERCRGGDFAAAAAFAADIVGGLKMEVPARAPPKQKAAQDRNRDQHRKAAYLWSGRQPIDGSIAERYLREARRIRCPLPPTLGYLAPSKPEHHPALISAFSSVDEPEPGALAAPRNVQSVHLTLLRPDGSGKANVEPNKIIIGSPGSVPIVLAPANDLLALAIAEGIEDALTAHEATGLGAWAAGSAGRMPGLADVIPNHIECVTIYAHADDKDEAGRKHANALAAKLVSRHDAPQVLIEGLS